MKNTKNIIPIKHKKHRNFILCPTCNNKSKLIYSEMGGLQTRRCKLGHLFEVDTFFKKLGMLELNKQRVERIDRPLFTDGNYNDYIYGKFNYNIKRKSHGK